MFPVKLLLFKLSAYCVIQAAGYCVPSHPNIRLLLQCPAGTYYSNGFCRILSPQQTKNCSTETNSERNCNVESPKPHSVCPPGFSLLEGLCKHIFPATPLCPDGTYFFGGHCKQIIDPSSSCPKGTYLSEGQCKLSSQPLPSIPQCPNGTYFSEGKCKMESLPKLTCPPGSSMSGGVCTHFFPAIPVCPSGATYSKGFCKEIIPMLPNSTHGTPLKPVMPSLPTVPRCPPGTYLSEEFCNIDEFMDTLCPEGFIEQNKTCVKVLPCPPNSFIKNESCFVCPNNTNFFEDSCGKCLEGTQYVDGKCEPIPFDSSNNLIYCYGQECCKNLECFFCFQYCQKNTTETFYLSLCQSRCIRGLSPISDQIPLVKKESI